MQTVTSIPAASVPDQELVGIVADFVRLDQTRVFRRLLVVRCSALALLCAIIGAVVPGFSWAARIGSVAVFVAVPIWAFVTELHVSRRFSRRIGEVDGAVTEQIGGRLYDSWDL